MNLRAWIAGLGWVLVFVLGPVPSLRGETVSQFTVATYNLENYLDVPAPGRLPKTAEAKAKIREGLLALKPDVLAVQEIGRPGALQELRASLKAEGLDFPYSEHVGGSDTNLFVGVLSRFPITARRPHTNENFLLRGRRFQVSRGFVEVDIQVNPRYAFTLITAHLKSRRAVEYGDEGELREQEALLLRKWIEARLKQNPQANLVVLGDFNDTKDSRTVRVITGQGRTRLVDTRPAERNGDDGRAANPGWDPRNVTWTYYYGKADSYERIDYLLVSPGMAREWDPAATRILTLAGWGLGSDHRPIIAGFAATDR